MDDVIHVAIPISEGQEISEEVLESIRRQTIPTEVDIVVKAKYIPPRDERPGAPVNPPQVFEDLRSGNNSRSDAGNSGAAKVSTGKSGVVLGEKRDLPV